MQELKTKVQCTFYGHTTKKNGDLDLKFKVPYSELINVVSLIRMVNSNVGVKARVNNKDPFSLGTFYLNKITIDREGESVIIFNTELTSSEIDNFKELYEPEANIILLCKAVIEDGDE